MKYIKSLICVICVVMALSSCSSERERYMFGLYTVDEVKRIYSENSELFENIVDIIVSSEEFYEKGRIYERDDPDITSPYDDNLLYFDEDDRNTIKDFFESEKPYIILYENAKRYVYFTFISEDQKSSCSILFWTSENKDKFYDFKRYLAQDYIIEDISDVAILRIPRSR